jgi:enoyl-CoA hydratase/carnithine racemase
MSELRRSLDAGVLTLTLDREAQRNALSGALIAQLLEALAQAETDPGVRVVVLTAAGARVFCAGADLAAGLGGEGEGFLATHEGRRRYGELLQALSGSSRPTVARVAGHALAGGLGLVCACDLALCADDVEFGTPEVNVGLFPYMVTAFLLKAVPPKHALEMVLTGRRVPAREAERLGLVNRAVPRDRLDAEVAALAATLAAKSPAVLRLGKRAMRRARDLPLESALELLASQLTINSLAEDAAEGISSFLEKRPPEWRGR